LVQETEVCQSNKTSLAGRQGKGNPKGWENTSTFIKVNAQQEMGYAMEPPLLE
jgi:hypothetical protein